MRSYADNIFSILSDHMYAEEVSGTTEAPTGYFALVEVPSHPAERAQMFKDLEAIIQPDKIQRHAVEPGWYVVISTDQGYTYPVPYDSEGEARIAFDAMVDEYDLWDSEDEEDDEPHPDMFPHDEHTGLDLPSYGE